MPVTEEKHHSHWVVELIHGIEIGHMLVVYYIELGEVLYRLSTLAEDLVHLHAIFVGVSSEPDADNSIFFRKDGLVNFPAIIKVR